MVIHALLITGGIIAGFFMLFLWGVHPRMNNQRKEQTLQLAKWEFAHRGLWDMKQKIPENSIPAFARAVEKGYAIELDVHLTRDGSLVVFHDDSLMRICHVHGTCESMDLAALQKLPLSHTDCHMPLLQDVLKLVNGRVPLLIELKLPSVHTEICSHVYEALKGYSGPYLIESFNPLGLRKYKKLDPDVMIGQLAGKYTARDHLHPLIALLSSSLLVNTLSRPDFVAYNFRTDDAFGLYLNHNLFKIPVFAWTVRTVEEFRRCRPCYDGIIFEKFLP
ncbi:MAG: glycerophosphodiester phosphodiesterase [Eubacterium sp.]|nr:glycerophosphodiester phosphodiesterase [Eubacterium sp.]